MTTFSTGAAMMDARLQGQARALGLQRAYFDLREYTRARRERLDLSVNRATGFSATRAASAIVINNSVRSVSRSPEAAKPG